MEVGAEKAESREGRAPARFGGERLWRSLGACILGFLFSRLHTVFSANPIAIALVAFLPSDVYFALLGAIAGGFSQEGGFISAISLLITIFVRVIIGTADKESRLFSEPLILRMSAGLLGGFVFAVYEWLISGVSVATALYGAAMLLIPPLSVFLFSGMSDHAPIDILLGRATLPSISGGDFQGKVSSVFFYISSILFLHTVARSLSDISILGIDLALVFSSAITILVAARHGAVAGGVTGFFVTLGVAGVQTVSFALLGLLSGALYFLGAPLSVTAGGLAFCLWSGYSGGLSGVLSTAPELIIAIAATLPTLKGRAKRPAAPETADNATPADTLSRVGTMALSYRSKYSENTERALASIEAVAAILRREVGEMPRPTLKEYEEVVRLAINGFCAECEHREGCLKREVCPAMYGAGEFAAALSSGGRISSSDINTEREFCERCAELAKRINERASLLEYRHTELWRASRIGDEMSLIAKMVSEARERDRADVLMNAERSEAAKSALLAAGLTDFSVRVFGEGRMRVFLAVADGDGSKISSPSIKAALTEALSAELCDVEYYRDGAVSMLEGSVSEKYAVSFAYKIKAGEGEVSGDSAAGVRCADGAFYGMLADGMGRGVGAHEASEYLISTARNLLSFGISRETLVKLLACLMARRGEAHSTLDLFRLDLYTGEASFIKCGAAPSYVKRKGTIYRIGSEGTPIGVGAEVSGERIGVEVRAGDLVIMTSDGVGDTGRGQLEFIERMSGDEGESLSEFAEALVSGAGGDDRTALVIRIEESGKKTDGA